MNLIKFKIDGSGRCSTFCPYNKRDLYTGAIRNVGSYGCKDCGYNQNIRHFPFFDVDCSCEDIGEIVNIVELI
jgi:hypothetical protein